jgi:hypothetical protein
MVSEIPSAILLVNAAPNARPSAVLWIASPTIIMMTNGVIPENIMVLVVRTCGNNCGVFLLDHIRDKFIALFIALSIYQLLLEK